MEHVVRGTKVSENSPQIERTGGQGARDLAERAQNTEASHQITELPQGPLFEAVKKRFP